jgi:hypothetical protein
VNPIALRSLKAGIVTAILGVAAHYFLPGLFWAVSGKAGLPPGLVTVLAVFVEIIQMTVVPIGVGLIVACVVIEGVTHTNRGTAPPPSPQ